MTKKETPDEKRARFLAMAAQGAHEFRPDPPPPPAAPAPPPTAPKKTEKVNHSSQHDRLPSEPPEEEEEAPSAPEAFVFNEPTPSRKGLRERGWSEGTSLYDPDVKKRAQALAKDLGIPFAELQNMALGLVIDPKKRNTETDALLARVKSRFQ